MQQIPGNRQDSFLHLFSAMGQTYKLHTPPGALTIIKGDLAPDGAVLKKAAANPSLMKHKGPAVVFESPADAAELERRAALVKPFTLPQRGWRRLYTQHVLQAHKGADLDFL
ncbi:dihydroxy-acid dehydratase [candidate division CSSED10-310 bacterium]|uniref:Dihydroxy-acid dehydratase n=1 Tax=candidate division CSSED10-310 bacterium TaxID=2855610 RepID=A0ABV6YWR7_UNCC1